MFKAMFTKKNILGYIYNLFFFTIILISIMYSVVLVTDQQKTKATRKTIENIISTEGVDLTLMCAVSNCRYIKRGNAEYYNSDGLLKLTKHELCTKDAKVISIPNKDIKIWLKNTGFKQLLTNTMIAEFILFYFLFTIYYLRLLYIRERNGVMENKMLKLELESKLHLTVTEFAHHEMLMPVAITKTLIEDLFIDKYPCPNKKFTVCKYDKDVSSCLRCKVYKDSVSKHELDYYNRIMMAMERLEAVLNQMSGAKNIKYSNGNISITKIINTVINGINKIAIGRIKLTINSLELTNNYAVSSILGNGVFLNLINNHITNSKEAKAENVWITAKMCPDGDKMHIYIKDDGLGIRDKHNKIINTNNIFKAGYSTKDVNGEMITTKLTLKDRLFNLFKEDTSYNSPRGVGLYINKGLLKKVGGDIILLETSKKGTTFELIVPVKKRKND